MVKYRTVVMELCKVEFEVLHLEFIARDIVLQRHSLRFSRLDIVEQSLGQFDILLHDFDAVVNLCYVEIFTDSEEPLLLPYLFCTDGSLSGRYLSEAHSRVQGSSCVDRLTCFECEVVAEMRGVKTVGVSEVAVCHQSVSDVTGAETRVDIRQFLTLRYFDALLRYLFAGSLCLQTLAVRFYEFKELMDGQLFSITLSPDCMRCRKG